MPKSKKPKTIPKKPTPKKVKFNDQARARADAQMASRALNTLIFERDGIRKSQRYGVDPRNVFVGVNLKERVLDRAQKVKREFRETKSRLKAVKKVFTANRINGVYVSNFKGRKKETSQDQGKIKLTKPQFSLKLGRRYYKRKYYYRPLIFHEFVHSMHLPNEVILSSAFERYLQNSFSTATKNLSSEEIVKRAVSLQILRDRISKKEKTQLVEEHRNTREFDAPSKIGVNLGDIAWALEQKLKQKGIGMFFIRDFGFNQNVTEVISQISKGQFDADLKNWLKMNPRLARMLN